MTFYTSFTEDQREGKEVHGSVYIQGSQDQKMPRYSRLYADYVHIRLLAQNILSRFSFELGISF